MREQFPYIFYPIFPKRKLYKLRQLACSTMKNFRMDREVHKILEDTKQELRDRGMEKATLGDAVRELYRRQAK